MAAELQRKDLAMWLCDDDEQATVPALDLGEGVKPPVRDRKRGIARFFSKSFSFFYLLIMATLSDTKLVWCLFTTWLPLTQHEDTLAANWMMSWNNPYAHVVSVPSLPTIIFRCGYRKTG